MDGSAWCWGDNGDGQLGPGMVVAPGMPVQVPGITDASGVACGRAFSCVLHHAGTIDCFGANDQGQLGGGAMGGGPTPVRVMGLMDATSIGAAIAGTHACAVRMSGLLACWGGNASGQLGDMTTMARHAPVMIAMPTDVSAVAPGGIAADGTGHTCALDREGRVWCWGDAALGQLGNGSYAVQMPPRPVLVLGAM
jgi:alpha-tubulin suppressor-like RCC1 family protein